METIRKERENQGLSQRDLAKMAKVSRTAVFNMETGQSNPSFGTLKAVVTALSRNSR